MCTQSHCICRHMLTQTELTYTHTHTSIYIPSTSHMHAHIFSNMLKLQPGWRTLVKVGLTFMGVYCLSVWLVSAQPLHKPGLVPTGQIGCDVCPLSSCCVDMCICARNIESLCSEMPGLVATIPSACLLHFDSSQRSRNVAETQVCSGQTVGLIACMGHCKYVVVVYYGL